jgi:tetratricopeptide (TPR) repeat protein
MILRSLLVCICLACTVYGHADIAEMDPGLIKYTQGENSQNGEQRKKYFNEALSYYLHVEPENPSGILCYNIANCYYQLGEYGLATLYYYKALKLIPRDKRVYTNIRQAALKTGQEFQQPIIPFSIYEIQLFFIAFLVVAFIVWSTALWFRYKLFTKISYGLGAIAFSLGLFLVWHAYFAPLEAVIIRPSALRIGAGAQYALVEGRPATTGEKVHVEAITQKGQWLKVELNSGEAGYISADSARLI